MNTAAKGRMRTSARPTKRAARGGVTSRQAASSRYAGASPARGRTEARSP